MMSLSRLYAVERFRKLRFLMTDRTCTDTPNKLVADVLFQRDFPLQRPGEGK
jgi:hypothetical protein